MKLMPFRTASEASVTVSSPLVTCNGDRIDATQPLDKWDYVSTLSIRVPFRVHDESFLAETGLGSVFDAGLAVQADCPETGWRGLATHPASAACGHDADVELVVPPGVAAGKIKVSAFVYLDGDHDMNAATRVAHRGGSRLFTTGNILTLKLEGESAMFPTEALDFSAVELPAGAPWHLQLDATDFEAPFMKVVRLRINTAHPLADTLLTAQGSATSAMMHDVLLQLILAAEALVASQVPIPDDEESFGGVVNQNCVHFLGQSLDSVLSDLDHDRSRFMTRLKHVTGFMAGGEG